MRSMKNSVEFDADQDGSRDCGDQSQVLDGGARHDGASLTAKVDSRIDCRSFETTD
jgi:hypothetical protein